MFLSSVFAMFSFPVFSQPQDGDYLNGVQQSSIAQSGNLNTPSWIDIGAINMAW
jgi:hypothetical protein